MRPEGSDYGAATTSVEVRPLSVKTRSLHPFSGQMCCGIWAARNNRFVIDIAVQCAYAEHVRIPAILKYDTAPRRLAKKPSSAPNNRIIISRGTILRCLLFRVSEKTGDGGVFANKNQIVATRRRVSIETTLCRDAWCRVRRSLCRSHTWVTSACERLNVVCREY